MMNSFAGCLAAASLLISAILAAASGILGAVLATNPQVLLYGLCYTGAALCIGTAVRLSYSLLYALISSKKEH